MVEKTEANGLQAKQWITPEEAVAYSGIGRTRLYRYLTSGELRSAKLGRTRHINREDLDAFMEARIKSVNTRKEALM